MQERGEDRNMVPMKLNGLGSAQSAPETMVILLTPVEEDKYLLPSGEPMIFPVGVPAELAPIYFSKITQHFMPDRDTLELSHFYELISETKLQTLHIYQGKQGARPYLVFKDKKGEENSFRVSLPNGLLTAIHHNLPILMEQKLLETVAAVVKVNKGEPKSIRSERVNTVSPFDTIIQRIESGNKPDSPLPTSLIDVIGNFSIDERAKLMDVALEYENYEWAAVLKDLMNSNE